MSPTLIDMPSPYLGMQATTRHFGCLRRKLAVERVNFTADQSRFKDQAAYDSHQASEPVQNLFKYFGENPSLISGEPHLSFAEASSTFTRPKITEHSDPFIVWAAINYKEGKRVEALEGWKTVTSETEKNEPETLSYSILADKGNELTINTVEIYASEDYFRKVHVPSNAVKVNKEKYGDEIRTGISWQQLKLVGGFLHK